MYGSLRGYFSIWYPFFVDKVEVHVGFLGGEGILFPRHNNSLTKLEYKTHYLQV